MQKPKHNFDVSISVDKRTGALLAVYFEFRRGKSTVTREFGDGAALADYDKNGNLLGIEILSPLKLSVLNQIEGAEAEVRRFVKNASPREMVAVR